MASQVEQTELNSFVYKNHKTWRKLISGRSSLNISSASNKNNNQDRVMSGFCIEKKLDWLIICDGHGSNDVVDFLDMILIDDIICRCNSPVMFIQEIQKQLKNIDTGYSKFKKASGACITVLYASDKLIEIAWLGDCKAIVIKDNEIIYKTKDHNVSTDEEAVNFLKKNKSIYFENLGPKIVVNKKMIIELKENKYVIYNHKKDIYGNNIRLDACMLTRALGHAGRTFEKIESTCIPRETGKYRVFIATDGFWDMVSPLGDSSEWNTELVLARNRLMEKKNVLISCNNGIIDKKNKIKLRNLELEDMIFKERNLERMMILEKDANEIIPIILKRWKKEWAVQTKNGVINQRFSDGDDIGIGIWEGK